MEVVGIIAGIVVGGALVIAGVIKLQEGPAWIKQAADMGVKRPLARVVPYVEIVVGILAALPWLHPWSALLALALLLAFTVVIVLRLLDGTRPPCACFGSRSKKPLSYEHVLRNVALLAIGALAVVGGV